MCIRDSSSSVLLGRRRRGCGCGQEFGVVTVVFLDVDSGGGDNMSGRCCPVGVIVELWGVGHEFFQGADVSELLAGCLVQGEHNFLELVAKVVGVLPAGLESAVSDESLVDVVCLLGGDGGSTEHLVAECHKPFKEIQ